MDDVRKRNALTGVRGIFSYIKLFWEIDSGVEFLSPHGRMIKALKMDYKDTWESINGQTLLNVDLLLASFAFKSSSDHLLRLYKCVETVTELYFSSKSHCASRDFYA